MNLEGGWWEFINTELQGVETRWRGEASAANNFKSKIVGETTLLNRDLVTIGLQSLDDEKMKRLGEFSDSTLEKLL